MWLELLESTHDNLRVALAWFQEHDPAAGLQLMVDTWSYWEARSHYAEATRWLNDLLNLVPRDSPPRADALWVAGRMADRQGDFASAERLVAESVALARELDNRRGLARALVHLAYAKINALEFDGVAALLDEAIQICRELGDLTTLSWALNARANLVGRHGEYEQAAALIAEGAEISRKLGEPRRIAYHLNLLGQFARVAGHLERAGPPLEESLVIARSVGDADYITWALSELAMVALERDDVEQARRWLIEGLTLAQTMAKSLQSAGCLYRAALLALRGGETERGVRLLGAVNRSADPDQRVVKAPVDLSYYRIQVDAARAALGDDAFHATWAEGAAMAYGDAIAYALASKV
jgi:tetratricopeptide (TPR) repeat protein